MMKNDPPVSLFTMTANDVAEVVAIGLENNLSKWAYGDYVNELKRDDSIHIVAKIADACVGFIVLRVIISNGEAEIYNLAVRAEWQKCGIGGKLIEKAILSSQSKNIWLEVRESNHTAINFYRRHNFQSAGKRKNFYVGPVEDALLMRLEVKTVLSFE